MRSSEIGCSGQHQQDTRRKILIQPAPVKTAGVAVVEAIRLGHAPLHQRIVQAFAAVGFVRRDADILHQLVLLLQFPQVLGHHVGFETARTPATGVGWPAETPVRHQGGISFCLVFVKILLKGVGRFEPGDGPANIPFQLFQMVVHLWEFKAGVAEQDLVHLAAFLQQAQ